MSDELRIVGPFHAFTGYSNMARNVLHCAKAAGYKVQAVESDTRDLVVQYGTGRRTVEKQVPKLKYDLPEDQQRELDEALKTTVSAFAPTLLIQLMSNLNGWPQYQQGPSIGYTMTESDNVCPFWKHSARSVDMLLAPSRYVEETFQRVMPGIHTEYMPIPVDCRSWCDGEFVDEVRNRPPFLFLSVFHVSERKRWRDLITAFGEEFSSEGKEVGLLLKPNQYGPVDTQAGWARDMGAWAFVDNQDRNDYMLAALYRAAQCYVVPASEGFGLTYLEAGLCGVPSIALAKSGSTDVVNIDNGWQVPSFMEPLPGHMPHVYPRKSHNFASFTIDDLRATLRQAYEDHKRGVRKGPVAKAFARDNFSGPVLAPRLREVVEKSKEVWKDNRRKLVPVSKPEWVTTAGNWGDVMCCMGNIRKLQAQRGMGDVNVLYYGRDAKIADWLRAQERVGEVVAIVDPDKRTMENNYAALSQSKAHHAVAAWDRLLTDRAPTIGRGFIAMTHLCLAEDRPCNYWSGAKLSEEATDWARGIAAGLDKEFVLLNPLSVASNQMEDHWPYWPDAMLWCVQNLKCQIVITGQEHIPYPPFDNVVNLTTQTPTMQHLLALAELSAGMITTSNNLGIYAPIASIPSVVVCAKTCTEGSFYFKWMKHQAIDLIPYNDSMQEFVNATMARFPHFLAETPNAVDMQAETEADKSLEAVGRR